MRIDFHTHYVPPGIDRRPPWDAEPAALGDPSAVLGSLDGDEPAGRILSAPLEFVGTNGRGEVAAATIRALNDGVAELAARRPGRLYGLATVDAYRGEEAADELRRAVGELGLRGVFVESAKGALLPDATEARPALAAAAALGVPVFLHPVADAELMRRFRGYGRTGGRLARCTINAAAAIALVEGGVFEALPGLTVVVTALAFGAALVGCAARAGGRLYVDTTGLEPVAVAAAVALLGADRVVFGTDWPVVRESAERVAAALDACGIDAEARELVAGGNALRLLGAA